MNFLYLSVFILTWGIGDLYTTKIGYDIKKGFQETNPIFNIAFKHLGFHAMTLIKTIGTIVLIFLNDDTVFLFGTIAGSLVVVWNSLQIYKYAIGTKQ